MANPLSGESLPASLDTSAARDRILKTARALQGRSPALKPSEQAQLERYLSEHPRGPQPAAVEDVLALFKSQALRMSCTLAELNTLSELPAHVHGYLKEAGLPTTVTAWSEWAHLDWAQSGIALKTGRPAGDDLVTLTGAFAAVAETGTLVMASGPDTPATSHLLPETHIAVLYADQVVHTMEDAFDRMRAQLGQMPRGFNFVTGPSRTADIEQTIVLGAHGPYRVHLVLLPARGAAT